MNPSAKRKNVDVDALQGRASDPASSAWVGASAGSGKTKVLADRVTRLLLAGVPPQRILCLTFTRAAAAEMSIRLMNLLSDWAICAEERLDADLAALEGKTFDPELRTRSRRLFAHVLACPGGMRIQTIHGFAQEVLRRFPVEAGLAPHFAVIEESETAALKRAAIDDALENAAEGADPAAAKALAHMSGLMAEQTLRDLLEERLDESARLNEALRAQGGFDGLIGALRAALGLAPGEDESSLRRAATSEGAFEREGLKKAARILTEKGSKSFAARGAKILHFLAQDEEGRGLWLEDYKSAFLKKEGGAYAAMANADILKESPEIDEILRREAARLESLEERLETAETAAQTESVLTLALRVNEIYEKSKADRAALDYDDLIRRANELFARPGIAPWVLYKLDGGIDHILVDESQDTSPGQWHIVRTLADEYGFGESAYAERLRTLFVVGDEKQSIFSFQGADPAEFFRMRAHFAALFEKAEKPFREVPLNISFRSAPAILRAVDAVFADEAVRAGVSHEAVEHRAFRVEGAGRVEIWPLLSGRNEADEDEESQAEDADWLPPDSYEIAQNPAAELAKKIAAQIGAWIADGAAVYDRAAKAERPMQAGDVMILVRHRGPLVDHLVRELKERDIPVAGVDRMRLADQLAVMDLLALLQFALLPQDDLNLATVLRGPLIGASEDELMALAIGRPGSLWESLRGRAEEPFASWTAYLRAAAAKADFMPPLALLIGLLDAPCPADARSGRRAMLGRLGPEAEDPIDELLSAAADQSRRQGPSLQRFVQEMLGSETEIKRELEQAQGRVRLTTVHASKGLEAPVVILPDTTSLPEKKRLPKLVWTENETVPFYIPREKKNAVLSAARDTLYEKETAEYRRLLYVALTRAADRLIVCGYTNKRTPPDGCWYEIARKALAPLHQEGPDGEAEIVLSDYAVPPKAKKKAKEKPKAALPPLPAWALTPPPPEPSPPRPFTPSRPSEPEPPVLPPQDARFARGRLMHRLLQSLPDIEPARREAAAEKYLANRQHALSAAQQAEIKSEILRLVAAPSFAPFFGPQSRAEVPIIGLVGDKLISGQVDRLALVGGEVWILDYKTNRPPPASAKDIPALYRGQMEAYRAVLREIYPGKTVRCFLLWTYHAELMEILPGA